MRPPPRIPSCEVREVAPRHVQPPVAMPSAAMLQAAADAQVRPQPSNGPPADVASRPARPEEAGERFQAWCAAMGRLLRKAQCLGSTMRSQCHENE